MPPSSASKRDASAFGGLCKAWIRAIRLAEGALKDNDVDFAETVDEVTLTYAGGRIWWSFDGREGHVVGVDQYSLAESILALMQAGVFDEKEIEEGADEPAAPAPPAPAVPAPPAPAAPAPAPTLTLVGNDYIALAIKKCRKKSNIQIITDNLTGQELKSYFGTAAAKTHKMWTVSGKGPDSRYTLTQTGSDRVAVLLRDEELRSKLETAAAGVDESDDDGEKTEADDEGDKAAKDEETQGAQVMAFAQSILDETCTRMASTMNFALENYTHGVYRVAIERTRGKANAPCNLLIFANHEQMYNDGECTITNLKTALEIYLGLGDGSLAAPEPSVASARRGAAAIEPTPAEPAVAAAPAATPASSANGSSKRPMTETIVDPSEPTDPLQLANLAVAKLDSVNSERRTVRVKELRKKFYKELDGDDVTVVLDDDELAAKLAEVPARAVKVMLEEIPEDPRVQRIKDAKTKLEAAQQAAAAAQQASAEAEAELLALLEQVGGSSSTAKRARK